MSRLTRAQIAVLSLSLLTFATFGASSAQAASWMVEGAALKSSQPLKGSLSGLGGTLNTKIGGNEVEFNCTNNELTGMGVELEGKLSGKVRFTGCSTKLNGTIAPTCEPNNSGIEPGIILTNVVKGTLTEHSSGEWLLPVESTVEETVAGVKQPVFGRIKMPIECAIGNNIPIIGPRFALVDSSGMGEPSPGTKPGLLHEQVLHKVKEGPLTELWVLSKTEEHKATVFGEVRVELESGQTWSGSGVVVPRENPTWTVKSVDLTSGTKGLQASMASLGTLHTKIGGNKVEFNCPTAELLAASLEEKGNISSGFKVKFSKCTTKVNGSISPVCEPISGTEKGVVITNSFKAKLGEHSTGEGIVPIESTVEELVAGVKQPVFGRIKSLAECSIGSNVPVIGPRFVVVDAKGMGESTPGGKEGLLHEQKAHNTKEGPLTEIWVYSKTEEHKATILGEAQVELASGETWSGLP